MTRRKLQAHFVGRGVDAVEGVREYVHQLDGVRFLERKVDGAFDESLLRESDCLVVDCSAVTLDCGYAIRCAEDAGRPVLLITNDIFLWSGLGFPASLRQSRNTLLVTLRNNSLETTEKERIAWFLKVCDRLLLAPASKLPRESFSGVPSIKSITNDSVRGMLRTVLSLSAAGMELPPSRGVPLGGQGSCAAWTLSVSAACEGRWVSTSALSLTMQSSAQTRSWSSGPICADRNSTTSRPSSHSPWSGVQYSCRRALFFDGIESICYHCVPLLGAYF